MSAAPVRFASVDALRGLTVAAMLLVNTPGDWSHVYAPLLHAEWHGVTPTDLVFPFFLFIVGVSISLGVVPRAEAGGPRAALVRALLWRAVKIVALGLALHLLAYLLLDRPHVRPWGVLQRIGVCFAVAGLLALYAKPRMQWALIGAILLGYWALLAPFGYAPYTNLPARVDTALFAPWLYQWDATLARGQDPEGLLSTWPAIATTLLGARVGAWLRAGALRAMVLAGAAAVAAGLAWSAVFPLNKALWTSSYAVFAAGCASLALALAHVLVDRLGWPALGRRFGANAIAAYVGAAVTTYLLLGLGWMQPLYRHAFAGWITPRFGPHVSSLAFALSFVGAWWLVVWAMDRRGWHLKV
jgi:predicted acyltransferase